MSRLFSCGVCWFLISIWGSIQLFIMAICYYFEVVTLIEDVEEEEYEDYEDFIKKTKDNYSAVSRNCFIAGLFYLVLILVSYGCIIKARRQMKREALLLVDDEVYCEAKKLLPRKEKRNM